MVDDFKGVLRRDTEALRGKEEEHEEERSRRRSGTKQSTIDNRRPASDVQRVTMTQPTAMGAVCRALGIVGALFVAERADDARAAAAH